MDPPTKPFSSRFPTNYAPTDDEVLEIKNLISVPLVQVAQIKEKMAQIKREISDLQQQYDAWEGTCASILREASVKDYQALLAPIRRLPPEILQQIFLFTIPDNHYAVVSPNDAPVSLTHTCGRWRRIAVKMPSLWTSVHVSIPSQIIEDPDYVKRAIDARVSALKRWIKRSHDYPFDFSVYDPGTELDLEVPRKRLFGLLCSVSKQWRRVKIHAPPDVLQRIAKLKRKDIPLLEEFEVHTNLLSSAVSYNDDDEVIIWGRSMALAAPLLTRFKTNTVSESLRKFRLPYKQLTHLELGHGLLPSREPFLSVSRLAWILPLMTNLVSGSFVVSAASFEFPEQPIKLPQLESLVITEMGREVDCSELFGRLVIPKLKHLTYHSTPLVNAEATLSYMALRTILRIASPTLESLEVNALMFPSREFIINCLRYLANVRKLHFVDMSPSNVPGALHPGTHFDDVLLDTLISTSESPNKYLLPKVEDIRIECLSKFTDAAICEFLGFRSGTLPGIRICALKSFSVVVEHSCPDDGGVPKQMEHLVKAGLALMVMYSGARPYPRAVDASISSGPLSSAYDGLANF
ncbi:hypothetical protein NLJ89_g1086 [Agrocybe chaxingu]|uniref:F-box domain-containing protein n=1 Tax=Agrocybe chaxingu TaxID=84603 RepID=A0A9W8TDW1_9AGAR|nr:hypothetical protein NLJ89_g1086 [Agrocybe chaxingu]